MNRTVFIERLKETQRALEKLLVLLESSQGDKFASFKGEFSQWKHLLPVGE